MNGWRSFFVRSAVLLLLHMSGVAGEISFRYDILPVLTKAGCNAGACHGASTGQGGFRLSLLGYDPEFDYERITHERGGRRINPGSPEESLLLRKPTEALDHEGGKRISKDTEAYRTLLNWIKDGAPFGASNLEVTGLSVTPQEILFEEAESAQLQVVARFSNQTERDVTQLALFSSNDDGVAKVGKFGVVTRVSSGLTSIMIRCLGQVAAVRVAIPFGGARADQSNFVPKNLIDGPVLSELKRLNIPSSEVSSDSEFLRRVYLDLTGRLPSAAEARAFTAQTRTPEERLKVIDRLLASSDFVDCWTMRLADLLLLSSKRSGEKGAQTYFTWLREQVRLNTPLDRVTRDLITATGRGTSSGPANFFGLATDPRDLGEHVGRIFLGTQIACARCHAHPADRWTQTDYYQFASYFAGVSRDGDLVKYVPHAGVEHPKTGRRVSPKPLGAPAQPANPDSDPRAQLADWMTSPNNPLFARSLVNRVWKNLLGTGLVEPVDDLRPTNPASHPALLNGLAADFARSGFDLRHLLRVIASSRTYQASSKTLDGNKTDMRLYSHALAKPLPAPIFLDAIVQVTEAPQTFDGYAPGTRAIQLIDARTPSYALDVLGRCTRERNCETGNLVGGGLAQALHLINGKTIHEKLSQSVIAHLLESNLAGRAAVEELYFRAFSRPPSLTEADTWEMPARSREGLEDLLWAILNSREFSVIH